VRERRAKRGNGAAGALILLCLALLVAATACSGDGAGQTTTAVTPEPTATAVPPIDLEHIVWAGSVDPETSAPVDRRDAFPRDADVIHAVVRTGPLPAGITLTARWSFNGQPVEGATPMVTATDGREAGWIEFHLEWTGGGLWPVGTLGVNVSATTGEAISGTVEIAGT
jgi:hypothetical protein